MAGLEQDLLSALQTLESTKEKGCGCQEKAGLTSEFDIFSSEASPTGDLGAQLEAALDQISSGEVFDLGSDAFSLDEDLAFLDFAGLEEATPLDVNDIIAAAERYPGLKITFSF